MLTVVLCSYDYDYNCWKLGSVQIFSISSLHFYQSLFAKILINVVCSDDLFHLEQIHVVNEVIEQYIVDAGDRVGEVRVVTTQSPESGAEQKIVTA